MRLFRFIVVTCLLWASVADAYAQLKIVSREKLEAVSAPRLSKDSAALVFDTRHIIAESMNEDDQPVDFIYSFINRGNDTIRFKRLVSTCSCASASMERMSVPAGERAEIRLRYNPKGHPGRFERKVFVYTVGEDLPAAVLRLSVDVSVGADISGDWPVQMGQIRLRRSHVRFEEGIKAVEKLRFINLGEKPLALQCEDVFLPDCLSFRTEPSVVDKGSEGQIVISYDPSKESLRETHKAILKGLGLPPGKSSINVIIEK